MTLFALAEVTVLSVSLIFIGIQILLQRRQLVHQVDLQSYELYHTLVCQYMELLYRADKDPVLNRIWEIDDPDRVKELDAAQAKNLWGAWFIMDQDERRCYRFTRYALETFEQAFQVYQKEWIDMETWNKWSAWIDIWTRSRYFKYVFEDTRPRLLDSFEKELDNLDVGTPKQTLQESPPQRRVSVVETKVEEGKRAGD